MHLHMLVHVPLPARKQIRAASPIGGVRERERLRAGARAGDGKLEGLPRRVLIGESQAKRTKHPVRLHVLVHVPLPARKQIQPPRLSGVFGNGNVYVQVHVQGILAKR